MNRGREILKIQHSPDKNNDETVVKNKTEKVSKT